MMSRNALALRPNPTLVAGISVLLSRLVHQLVIKQALPRARFTPVKLPFALA